MEPLRILLLALLAAGSSLSQPTAGLRISRQLVVSNLTVTNVALTCMRQSDDMRYSCTLDYDLSDPSSDRYEPIRGAACRHEISWDGQSSQPGPGADYSSEYFECWVGRTSMVMAKINHFATPRNISLTVQHAFVTSGSGISANALELFFNVQMSLFPIRTQHNAIRFQNNVSISTPFSGAAT